MAEKNRRAEEGGARTWFARGLRNGIPICAGYFAVSFALGIAARQAGMNAVQSFLMSLGMVASAGQFAGIGLIAAGAGAVEMITTTLVVNLRYFLMSCAMTQKLRPGGGAVHRALIAYCMTDEIFGLSVTVDGYLHPAYTYGITVISVAGWCAGTVCGVLVGNILPPVVSNALGVAMYGMFLAIIIPPAKKDHFIGALVAISMLASGLFAVLPGLKAISSGFRIIILTLVIAGIAAAVRPIDEADEADTDEPDSPAPSARAADHTGSAAAVRPIDEADEAETDEPDSPAPSARAAGHTGSAAAAAQQPTAAGHTSDAVAIAQQPAAGGMAAGQERGRAE